MFLVLKEKQLIIKGHLNEILSAWKRHFGS